MTTKVVLHVWIDIFDRVNQQALADICLGASHADVQTAIEYHCLPSAEQRSLADELIYAAKAQGTSPEEAAINGLQMARHLIDTGIDLTNQVELAQTGAILGLTPDDILTGFNSGQWTTSVNTDIADGQRLHATPPYVLIGGLFAMGGEISRADLIGFINQAGTVLGAQVQASVKEAQILAHYRPEE